MPTDSVHVVFRVQSKTPLNNGWTLAMQFDEPQMFAISSADVDFKWNCRRNILTATPRKFNFALNAKRSHNFMALIEGAQRDEIEGSFRMFLYDGIIKPDSANCLDADFGPDYCPDKPEPTKPDPTITHFTTSTVEPTITLPTIDPTKPDPTKPDPTKPDPTKPDPTKPDPTRPDPTITLSTVDPTKPDPTKPDPTKPDPTKPDPTVTLPTIDPTRPDPTKPEPTITMSTIEPTKPEPMCVDRDATYGIKEHKTGKGGCPPTPINYSLVNAELQKRIPLDANACYGTHIDARSYVNAGVGAEKGYRNRDAFVSRFNLCKGKFNYSLIYFVILV